MRNPLNLFRSGTPTVDEIVVAPEVAPSEQELIAAYEAGVASVPVADALPLLGSTALVSRLVADRTALDEQIDSARFETLTPDEQADHVKIHTEGLDIRTDEVLTEMRTVHQDKFERLQDEFNAWHNPDFIRGEHFRLTGEGGMTPTEADTEIVERVTQWNWKHPKLSEIARLCQVEIGFRRDGKVDRAVVR